MPNGPTRKGYREDPGTGRQAAPGVERELLRGPGAAAQVRSEAGRRTAPDGRGEGGAPVAVLRAGPAGPDAPAAHEGRRPERARHRRRRLSRDAPAGLDHESGHGLAQPARLAALSVFGRNREASRTV